MDRRTYEGPMDWEYQDSGPFDPTSPFTHAAKSNAQNVFGSPSKSSRPNPFSSIKTPAKSQPIPPQRSIFTPSLPPKTAAPPFRNPAFTTPRKPFDDLALSEPEDSPTLTEVSEIPNDTPEADRTTDLNMSPMSPTKVDKTSRYGRGVLSSKKIAPGRGEIRNHRDLSVVDLARKRKRYNLDRDVSTNIRNHAHDWDESDADSDGSIAPRGYGRSRNRNKSKKGEPRGFIGSVFHMLNEYPNAPDNLYRWIQLLVNFFLVFIFVYIGWAIVDTVRSDIRHANEAARMDLMSKMTECSTQYTMNECSKKDRPALRMMCEEWYDCMMQNPESIMRVKVTVKQIAEIMNEFSEAMNLKTWGFFFTVLILCAFANNLTFGRYNTVKPAAAVPSHTSNVATHNDISMPPESTPGFMWVPVQTPRMQRHGLLDEGTDTDSSPPKMKPILAAPYTPSGRRSPSKGERSRSPIKYARSPSKLY